MTVSPTFHICFVALGGVTREVTIAQGKAWPRESADALGLKVLRGPISWRLSICPQVPVRVLSVSAVVPSPLRSSDALFLSGYNCWTDSTEQAPIGITRGLEGVPRQVVDKWVLDGSGDYRFTPSDLRPGHMHGFGYCYARFDDEVELIASLTEDNGLTTIREDLFGQCWLLDKEPPARELAAGEQRELMGLCCVRASLPQAVSSWLACAHITRREAPALVGFSSWYRYYNDISAKRLSGDLASVAELLGSCDLGPCAGVFQVDDGYAKVGDWLEPSEEAFPEGMGAMARAVRDAGLVPGLWMAPFLVERESRVFAEHQDWLLRDDQGELVTCGSNWSGSVALDTRKPEVRAYVRESLSTATRDWGYRLLKLDFLFAACMLPHDGLNRGELMADALDLLRDSVPEGTWFDLCGVPQFHAFGRTEYCRVGCDVGLDWDDVPYMRALHRERVSTKRSLANTRAKAHLDGRVFRNDPDVFFLRRDVSLTDAQRADLLHADATCGGVFFTSDDVAAWDEGQLADFRAALKTFVDKER